MTAWKDCTHGKGEYPVKRVVAAVAAGLGLTVLSTHGTPGTTGIAWGIFIGLAVCISLPPLFHIRALLVLDSEIDLTDSGLERNSGERRKFIFGLFLLLAAWILYLAQVNTIRDTIISEQQLILGNARVPVDVHIPDVLRSKVDLMKRKQVDWWAFTIGQLVIFQVLLFLTFWLETCPKNAGFKRPLQAIWCIICLLNLINIWTVPGDAVLIRNIVSKSSANAPSAP